MRNGFTTLLKAYLVVMLSLKTLLHMRNLHTRIFIIILLTITYLTSPIFAQSEEDPVSWTFEYKAVSNSSNEYELRFIANTSSGWYIYSQDLESRPPVPTSFIFEKNVEDDFVMMGEIEEEGNLIVKYDELFEQEIKKYTDKVIFKARVLIADTKTIQINGHLEYMACDASTCKPPKQIEFLFEIEPDQNTPIVTTSPVDAYQTINSPVYSLEGTRSDNGMVINVHEGPIDIRESNSNTYEDTDVEIALTGSESIVNEDKEKIIDEKGGDLLVAANISSYLKKKKKKKAKKPAIANRTIQKKKEKKEPTSIRVSNPVKWNFELEKGEKQTYNLVFKATPKDKFNFSENLPKLSFDNEQSIVVGKDETKMEISEDGTVIFKKSVKFKNNVMLTGKINYTVTDVSGKELNRDASFAFNQSGEVVTYQSKAGWWIGSGVALFCLVLLTVVWKVRKTMFQ